MDYDADPREVELSGDRSDEHPCETPGTGGAAAATGAEDFTSASLVGEMLDIVRVDPERTGTAIGSYRLLAILGQGGFGTVFRAEQQKPVRRLVALKILKLGMDSRQVVARFEAERQALAIMDHPGIAKVFDAGTTLEGRPYFVMELVDGEPITGWCDAQRLDIDGRIDLFRQVCAAVQHAHLKGVIHRDLKPSNILVSTVDGRPQAKVIDFGIAKAVSADVGSAAVTAEQQVIGTFEYMSPEQAEGRPDIDTRTDVYALAAVLHELLVGAAPLPRAGLRDVGILERVRVIRVDQPPTLGPRLLAEPERDLIAARRATDAPRLARRLAGELTWIVLRGLEKDPSRRYESPSALAADLGRALRNEPVDAGPPSGWYRFRTFSRRHRAGLAISAAAVALLAGTAVTTTLWANRARDAEAKALARLDQFQGITRYFTDELLDAATPKLPREGDTTVRQVLNESVLTVDDIRDPLVRSTVRQAIARTYRRLGLTEVALPLFQKTLAERRTLADSDHAVGETLHDIGMSLTILDQPDAALPYLEEALALRTRVDGPRSTEVAETLDAIAHRNQRIGRLDEAERGMRDAIEIYREHGRESRKDLSSLLVNLARLLANSKRDDEAIVLYREALALREETLGHDHFMTAQAMDVLGAVLGRTEEGRPEAERLVHEALAIRRLIFPPNHTIIASSLVGLGQLRLNGGRHEEAFVAFDDAARIYEARYGRAHEYVAAAMQGAARSLDGAGRRGEALARFDDVVSILTAIKPPDHWMIANARSMRGACLLALGESARAETDLVAAYDSLVGTMPARAVEPAESMAALCLAAGRTDDAAEWRDRAERARRRTSVAARPAGNGPP